MKRSVLQDWVMKLTLMQQSVLIASVRGPDGLHKDHPSKVLCRWLRRCFLISAFDGKALTDPVYPGGGSFTGPSVTPEEVDAIDAKYPNRGRRLPRWYYVMIDKAKDYLRTTDQTPHHFTLHLLHAAEILGYKHPTPSIRHFWREFYLMGVNDMHLYPEPESAMDKRLGDNERSWRAREEVIAK